MRTLLLVLGAQLGCTGVESSGDSGAESEEESACDSPLGTLQVHIEQGWGGGYDEATSITVEPEGGDAFQVPTSGADVSVDLDAGNYTVWMPEDGEGCASDVDHLVTIEACGLTELEIMIDCWGR